MLNGDEHTENSTLSYQDFVPTRLDRASGGITDVYQRFNSLVDRANSWLQDRPWIKIVSCETVALKAHHGLCHVYTDKSSLNSSDPGSLLLKCLRLWVCRKQPSDVPEAEQLGHVTVVPMTTVRRGAQGSRLASGETFRQLMDRLNQRLEEQPVPGKLINVETLHLKVTSLQELDADRSWQCMHGDRHIYSLVTLRLFYITGPPAYECIDYVEFAPHRLGEGNSSNGVPRYQPFQQVVGRVTDWLDRNPTFNLLNLQTVYTEMGRSSDGIGRQYKLDTQKTLYEGNAQRLERFLSILRVYGVSNGDITHTVSDTACTVSDITPTASTRTISSCHTFIARQLTRPGAFSRPQFETMSEVVETMKYTLQQSQDARVVGAETVQIPVASTKTDQETADSAEVTCLSTRKEPTNNVLYGLRIYISGQLQSPIDNLPTALLAHQSTLLSELTPPTSALNCTIF